MAAFKEYQNYDGLGLAELIAQGQAAPDEVLEAAIESIERQNPALNAVVYKMYDAARAALKILPAGPFRGVPFLLKDLLADLAGHPTTASSRLLSNYVPDFDSTLVTRYKRAGVVILGKTNLPEFGILGVTESRYRGACKNPWDLTLTPGGSSGGAACAVAARMVPMAHGGDGGGSIRIPASACGCFGFKPSRGLMPLGPQRSEAWAGFACEHVITRTVRDSAAMLDVTQGAEPGAPYSSPPVSGRFLELIRQPPRRLKIAFTAEPLSANEMSEECKVALARAVALCQDLGHELVEAGPDYDKKEAVRAFAVVMAASVARELEVAAAAVGKVLRARDVEDITWLLKMVGDALKGSEVMWGIEKARELGRLLGEFFLTYDVLLTPTLTFPPPKLGSMDQPWHERALLGALKAIPARPLLMRVLDETTEKALSRGPNTPLFNQAGLPAMSLPLHWTGDGIPIGIQFAAALGGDGLLLQLAAQLEEAAPWRDRRPPRQPAG